MTTIETKIARAKELAEKATPGPWCSRLIGMVFRFIRKNCGPWDDDEQHDASKPRPQEEDADFIAEARTLLPDLASECERLRALVESMEKAGDQMRCALSMRATFHPSIQAWTDAKRNLTQPTP